MDFKVTVTNVLAITWSQSERIKTGAHITSLVVPFFFLFKILL